MFSLLRVAILTALGVLGFKATKRLQTTSPAQTVEAEQFILRDSRGAHRAIWGLTTEDNPMLQINGPGGDTMMTFLVAKSDDGPILQVSGPFESFVSLLFRSDKSLALSMHDQLGPRCVLGIHEGMPSLSMNDEALNNRLDLSVMPDVEVEGEDTARAPVCFGLLDGQERGRVLLSVTADGDSSVVLTDAEMNDRLGLSVDEGGSPSLSLRDAEEKTGCTVECSETGTPVMKVFVGHQNAEISLGFSDENHPKIKISDNGPVWAAP